MGCSTSSRATTTRGGCTPTTTSRVQTKPKPAGAHARWQHNLGVHETGASPPFLQPRITRWLLIMGASILHDPIRKNFEAAPSSGIRPEYETATDASIVRRASQTLV